MTDSLSFAEGLGFERREGGILSIHQEGLTLKSHSIVGDRTFHASPGAEGFQRLVLGGKVRELELRLLKFILGRANLDTALRPFLISLVKGSHSAATQNVAFQKDLPEKPLSTKATELGCSLRHLQLKVRQAGLGTPSGLRDLFRLKTILELRQEGRIWDDIARCLHLSGPAAVAQVVRRVTGSPMGRLDRTSAVEVTGAILSKMKAGLNR